MFWEKLKNLQQTICYNSYYLYLLQLKTNNNIIIQEYNNSIMKTLLLIAIILMAVNCKEKLEGTWFSTNINQFTGMSLQELRQYTGTILSTPEKTNNGKGLGKKQNSLTALSSITTDKALFDSLSKTLTHSTYTSAFPIRDQGKCGSCWAFAVTEVFSDIINTATNGSLKVVLSPQDMVSCDTNDYGCDGGYLDKAWDFVANTGLVSDSCYPYTSGTGVSGTCQSVPSTCLHSKATNVRKLTFDQAMKEIDSGRPVVAGFNVYSKFFSYSSGVYQFTKGDSLAGGHAVKIIGWGTTSAGIRYWRCANSWGALWGDQGRFNIQFGDCGINDNLWTATYRSTS